MAALGHGLPVQPDKNRVRFLLKLPFLKGLETDWVSPIRLSPYRVQCGNGRPEITVAIMPMESVHKNRDIV
jgi:hypothetical protein